MRILPGPAHRTPSAGAQRVLKACVFVLCLVPALRLAAWAGMGRLGANPIETITRSTGWWALAMLVLTLSVTPVRRLLGWPWLLRLRRMLGLYAFAYGTVHFGIYLWLDQFFDWGEILKDIAKRPFITVGFAALLAMAPLAVTSTAAMVRRLGAKRWLALHRLVYLVAILGAVHFLWLVKRDVTEPVIFLGLFSVLLGARAVFLRRDAADAKARALSQTSSSDRSAWRRLSTPASSSGGKP
jgi:sulfoxide reductase heme-binding subunit YedZ